MDTGWENRDGHNGWQTVQPPEQIALSAAGDPSDGSKPKKKTNAVTVLAVQSIACAVLLLAALLLRFAGGEGYTRLREQIGQALANNELAAVIGRMWDGDPTEAAESALTEANENAPAADG